MQLVNPSEFTRNEGGGSAIPKLEAPIVLVHGLCGFDRIYAFRRSMIDYFPGICERLEAAGNRVFVACVSPTSGVADRARDLKRFIEHNVPAGPLHVIGHSMGGLDARFMIAKLGMDARVRSLTTIGTPHRGTAFADWGIRHFGSVLTPFLDLAGIPHRAFYDLTTESCQRFNERVPDVPCVRYFSIAGRCDADLVGAEWMVPHGIVTRAEGPNDGVVSITSAEWGEQTEVWLGDHLNLVNWPNRLALKRGLWNDLAPDFGRIVRRLAAAGL